MYISLPEVSALLQNMQPTLPLFQIMEGYRDIQSVVAVMETQESFSFSENQAQLKQENASINIPDKKHRVRYLGFFLTQNIQLDQSIQFKVALGSPLAFERFTLFMRSFSVIGKHTPKITHGISLKSEGQVSPQGLAKFDFAPLSELLKKPEKLTGFQVYLMRPKPDPKQELSPETTQEHLESSKIEKETTPNKVVPKLNIYRKIDTRA